MNKNAIDNAVQIRTATDSMAKLRIRVFISWLIFAVILSLLPVVLYIKEHANNRIYLDTMTEAIKMLAGLWLPALSCFSAFWFSETNNMLAHEIAPTTGQKIGTYSLIMLYYFLCIIFISVTLFAQFSVQFIKSLASMISTIQLFSPALLAPIGLLTGKIPTPPKES
jgi:hypothetical protein